MTDNKQMKILIATGIYPPDVGGPATYAANLSRGLLRLNCAVKIVSYGKQNSEAKNGVIFIDRTKNIFGRYLIFFWRVYRAAAWADIVYILDLVSVGFPAMMAAKLSGKKIVFRTGGDFLWEKAYQSGWTDLPLVKYYENKKSRREKILMGFCRWILKNINLIIFSTKLQAAIYEKYYRVPAGKSVILSNALPRVRAGQAEAQFKDSIIFAGRLIGLKNLERLIRVFAAIETKADLLMFGAGPAREKLQKIIQGFGLENRVKLMGVVPHVRLMEIIAGCRFLILPSITEISPNLALECIGLGQAVILTRETGLDDILTGHLLLVDPLSEKDLEDKIRYLLDDNNLAAYKDKLRQINFSWREWSQVAGEHCAIFKKLTQTA